MRVLIRADAAVQIGSGHLMRCLTLADHLRAEGGDVAFVCRDLPGSMFDVLEARRYPCARLPFCEAGDGSQDADARETIKAAEGLFPDGLEWLVVDHYQLDAAWEAVLRPHVRKLMAIDDLANRQHDCDVLLDQNFYRDQDRRYLGLLPEGCVTLLGPGYALLRPEFVEARRRPRSRDGSVKRILVFFGGSDPTNQTEKVLSALAQLKLKDIAVDVVVGSANPNRDAIQVLCSQLPEVAFHCQIFNMAELILNADLGIGAGGSAIWERCYLGLPTITVVLADNQVRTTEDVADIGAIAYLGRSDLLTPADYARAIVEMIDNPSRVKAIAAAALGVLQAARTSVTDAMRKVIQRDAPAGAI